MSEVQFRTLKPFDNNQSEFAYESSSFNIYETMDIYSVFLLSILYFYNLYIICFFEKKAENFHSRRCRSSLPGLRTLDPPLSLPST